MTRQRVSARAPRIFFANRFYAPDHSATAQMLTDVAEGLAARGHRVHVITSRMMYDDPSVRLPAREDLGGVQVVRLATTQFGRAGLAGRAVDYASFYMASFIRVLSDARRGDVVVVKTDPPLLSVPLGVAARLRGAKVVNWLQDIFPETAQALGVRIAGGQIGRMAAAARNRSVRTAVRTVVLGARMAERVQAFGAPEAAIALIPNFCDDTAIRPLAAADNPLREEWGFGPEDFVVGYSGNLGRAHDISTVLGAADALKDTPQIKFLFIGGGHLRRELDGEAARRGLTSIRTRPYQPRAQLGLSLCVPDVHWASLRPQLEGLILPSKLYGIAAAGRPLLMVGDPDGDIGRILRTHGFGSVVPTGAAETLASKITALMTAPEETRQMGQRARAYVEAHASRAHVLNLWSDLIEDVLAGR